MPSKGSEPAEKNFFVSNVRLVLSRNSLINKRDRVVVGVSGGADSVALLSVLSKLSSQFFLKVRVVHIDHQIRKDSANDAEFVSRLADSFGFPVDVIKKDVAALGRELSISIEDAARRARYDAFKEVAERYSSNKIALGHTADDQAETVLMRLIRGSGLTGLGAIPLKRKFGQALIIRPLLETWRREIISYLNEEKLSFVQDSTNQSVEYFRNKIRLELLPLLERGYNPNIKSLLSQFAFQCQGDYEFLQESAARFWKRIAKARHGQVLLNSGMLLSKPKGLQRQLIRMALKHVQGDLIGFEFRHWMEIEELLLNRPEGSIVDLPEGLCLEKLKGAVLIRHQNPRNCRN